MCFFNKSDFKNTTKLLSIGNQLEARIEYI